MNIQIKMPVNLLTEYNRRQKDITVIFVLIYK